MLKTGTFPVLAVASFSALPAAAQTQSETNKTNMVQACRVMHQEDVTVTVAQCLDFLQASDASRDSDWTAPFCRALAYYEPELFYSLYNSPNDCVVHNRSS